MHSRTVLLALALLPACSGSESAPTELHPALAIGGCSLTLTAGKSIPLAPATNSTGKATFVAKNVTCASNSSWSVSASRTGAVATITGVSPGGFVLAKGASKTVTVTFTTGPTAGQGTIKLIGSVDAPAADLSATLTVNVTAPAATGIPFGAAQLLDNVTPPTVFTLSHDFNSPSSIVTQINTARTKGMRLILVMTGGAHTVSNPGCCLSVINGVMQFDRRRWDSTLARFNTQPIRDAIASGVADSTIIGANVMDEPYVHGLGDGNTWGDINGKSPMTKARVDSLCGAVQAYFPTLPAGVEGQHQLFEQDKSYQVCQFIIDQYATRFGDVNAWRTAGTTMATRDHHQIIFSLNVLNGGTQDTDGTWDCSSQGGFKGMSSPNCQMTSQQLSTYGTALAPDGCALLMWKWDNVYFGRAANIPVFQQLADLAATVPFKQCRRTP
jgi:hypothetical protein